MLNCFLVGIGGFIGTVCRYLIGLLPIEPESGFPVKTLAINVSGAFLIGIITALAAKNKSISPQLILMLKVGICGGFTTFSTFSLETSNLLSNGKFGLAALYAALSVLLCLFGIFLAKVIVTKLAVR